MSNIWISAKPAAVVVPVVVQPVKSVSSGTNLTTQTVSYTANVTAGNMLIAVIGNGTGSVYPSQVKDGLNNINWTRAQIQLGQNMSAAIYFYPNTLGGACTVTVTYTAAATSPTVGILEVSGLAGLAEPGAGWNSWSASGTPNAGWVNPINPNSLVVAIAAPSSGASAGTAGWNYTTLASPGLTGFEYIIPSTTGTKTPTFTVTGGGSGCCATFTPSGGTPSPVKQGFTYYTTSSGITVGGAYSSAVAAGNTLIAVAGWNGATGSVTSVKDNVNNTNWTLAGVLEQGNGQTAGIYYYKNTLAGTPTVTLTISASQTNPTIVFFEVAGIAATGTVDVTSAATGTNSTPAPGALVTTAANDFCVAFAMSSGAASASPSEWVFQVITTVGAIQWQVLASLGTHTPSWSSGTNWAAVAAAFKHS